MCRSRWTLIDVPDLAEHADHVAAALEWHRGCG
jgi:hypothetical protein